MMLHPFASRFASNTLDRGAQENCLCMVKMALKFELQHDQLKIQARVQRTMPYPTRQDFGFIF
jgi:hypothetical protein